MELKWKWTGVEMFRQFDSCGAMKRAWKQHALWYKPCGHRACVDSLKLYRYSAEVMFSAVV